MVKRTIVSLTLAILVALFLASILSDIDQGNMQQVLKIASWIDPDADNDAYVLGLLELYMKFEEETGIHIEIVTIPYDELESKLVASNNHQKPIADVFRVSSQKLKYLTVEDALYPLDEYYNQLEVEELEDFIPIATELSKSKDDGHIYISLMGIHSRGLWYNKNHIEEPPTNWYELEEVCLELKDPDKGFYGYGFFGGKHYGNVEMTMASALWSLDAAISDGFGRLTISHDEGVQAIEFYGALVHNNLVDPKCAYQIDKSELNQDFIEGKIASLVTGTFMASEFLKSDFGEEGKLGFAPIPGRDSIGDNFSNGWAFAIPSNGKNKDLAWEFIHWFQSPEIQFEHSKINGCIPTRKTVLQNEYYQNELWQMMIFNANNYGRSIDEFTDYEDALESYMLVATSFFLDEKVDIFEALKEQEEKYNKRYFGNDGG